MSVAPASRFSRLNPCFVCGGGYDDPRGQSIRCHGFVSEDGEYAHCSRKDHAHGIDKSNGSDTYAHRLGSSCRCGGTHERRGSGSSAQDRPTAKSKGSPEATYSYRDEDGALLFEIVRWPDKGFSARRRSESGEWVWNRNGVRVVPYRLPEVLQAVRAGREVFITEGEKDADALCAAGEIATTNPSGAGKWRDDFSDYFKGARIVLWGDNDEKGREHIARVAAALASYAESVRIVWSKVGKDAADHLQAGLGVSDAVPDSEAVSRHETEWETPIPLTNDLDLPPFPTEALSPFHRDFVEALAEEKQVAADLPALLTLSIFSAAIAGKLQVQIAPHWSEHTALYTVCVSEPGTRKSPTGTDCLRPVYQIERERFDAAASAHREARQNFEVAKKRREKAEKAVVDAQPDSLHAARVAFAEACEEERQAEQAIPSLPQILIDNATPEALTSRMCANQGRIAFISAEGGGLFEIPTRYSKDGTPNLDLLLKAHSGEPVRIDRVNRDAEILENPILNIGIAVQPVVLADAARTQANRKRGLLARFLFALPPNNVGHRRIRTIEMPESVRMRYELAVRRAFELPDPVNEDGLLEARLVPLSADAAETLTSFQAELEPMLGEFGDLGRFADWGGKLTGAASRIALVLHSTDNIGDLGAMGSVPVETMKRAIEIARYFIPHARAAFASMNLDPEVTKARKALRWIRTQGADEFSKRDLHQAMRSDFERAEGVDPTLSMLESGHYIRPCATAPRGPNGGRPASPRYQVNPSCLLGGTDASEGCERSEVSSPPSSGEARSSVPTPASGDSSPLKRPNAPGRDSDPIRDADSTSRNPHNPQNSPQGGAREQFAL